MSQHLVKPNALLALVVLALAACSSSSTPDSDGGTPASDGGTSPDGGTGNQLNATFDPGFTKTTPNKPGSIEVTISGETLGENGLPFQPVNAGDPVFVDGWNLTFQKFIVVVGNVRLGPNATQSSVWNQVSAPVATKAGPYVVDVHRLVKNGTNGFIGSDGESPAGALFKWDAQDSGQPFDTGTRYSFTYDVVPAKFPATQVNLAADEFPIYDQMVAHGWTKYLEATATYAGTGTFADAAIQAKFAAMPKTVHFTFGWNDAASYVNCVNADFGDGEDLANRGVQTNTNGAVVAQITLHVDHLFWDKLLQEGTPLRFDPIAAWAPADTSTAPLSLNTLATKPLATTFSDGTPLPDRAPVQNVPGGYTSDQTNPNQVTLDLNGVPSANIKGLANFMAFGAQSQMHLNADGLCFVTGQHASDPWFAPNVQ